MVLSQHPGSKFLEFESSPRPVEPARLAGRNSQTPEHLEY